MKFLVKVLMMKMLKKFLENHILLGTFDPDYNTKYWTVYYDKSAMIPIDNLDTKKIERRLRFSQL